MSFIKDGADSREAVLLQIVCFVAYGEGRTTNTSSLAMRKEEFSREWLRDAFALARECVDGPRKEPARKPS